MISTCPRCDKQVSIPTGADSTAQVRCPLCNAEYALGEALALAPPELILLAAASVDEPAAIEDAAEEKPSEASPPSTDQEKENQPDSEEENEAATVAPRLSATAAASQWKQRRPQKSAIQMLVEVVLGGLAGCLVAYYGLAFWFGPQFRHVGLPDLPLPFIERITAPRPDDDPLKKPANEKSVQDLRAFPWHS